jgi:hypothetical protein
VAFLLKYDIYAPEIADILLNYTLTWFLVENTVGVDHSESPEFCNQSTNKDNTQGDDLTGKQLGCG